jgi:hypothetical protein
METKKGNEFGEKVKINKFHTTVSECGAIIFAAVCMK